MKKLILPFAVVSTIFSGCGGSAPPLAPPEPPVVTVQNPEVRELDSLAEFTGRLAAAETQEIRAQVTGYLKEIKFKDGDKVMENQVLYEIDPEPYDAALANAGAMIKKAESELNTSEKQLALAEKEFKRIEALGTSASQQERDRVSSTFDSAKSNVATAKAAILAAQAAEKKAKFDRENCTIRSQVKNVARVSRTELTKGNLVQSGQTILCRVTSINPIFVYFDVDEETSLTYRRKIFQDKTLPMVDSDQKLKIWVGMKDESRGKDGKWPHAGALNYVSPEIVRGLGTREVRGVIDNGDFRLTPGDSARVQVESGATEKLTIVPEIAIGTQQQQKFVYVVAEKDGKSIAEFRPVQLGPVREIDGLRWQIIRRGVGPTDRIVVNGLLRVRPGIEVKPVQATGTSSPAK